MPTSPDRDLTDSPSTPTRGQTAASLYVGALVCWGIAALLLDNSGLVGLAIGGVVGAMAVFGVWLSEDPPGRDTDDPTGTE